MRTEPAFKATTIHFATPVFLGVLLALAGGCTHNMKVRVAEPARVPAAVSSPIPLHVGLILTPEFANYSHTFERMGDAWVFPLGPTLQDHAVGICRHAFQRVTVSTNGSAPPNVDAMVIPQVHKTGYAIGSGKLIFTLLVEWTLQDGQTRNIVWVDTTEGRAKDNLKRVFQSLYDDLSTNTYTAMISAPEIKSFVERVE